MWCVCGKATAAEVPVLRAVTQKGETEGTCGFSDLLWEISVSGRLPLRDGIVLLLRLCVFGCCNNKTSMVKHDDRRKPELSSCHYFCLLGRCISL